MAQLAKYSFMNIFDNVQDTISDLRGIRRAGRAASQGTMGTAMMAMGGASPFEVRALGLTEKGLQRAGRDIVKDDGEGKDQDRLFK